MKQICLKLNNGTSIPQLGVKFEEKDGSIPEKIVLDILGKGFRHIKTLYKTKFEVPFGKIVNKSGISRSEMCISSTLPIKNYGSGKAYDCITNILNSMNLDYLDLLYIATPKSMMSKVIEAYKECEKALSEGKIKGIALSIVDTDVIDEIMNSVDVKPVIFEIECHPWCQQIELKEKIKQFDIHIESKYPIGHGKCGKFPVTDNLFIKLAEKHNKTPEQIADRWHLQEKNILIHDAISLGAVSDYLTGFISILDFELSQEEMDEIRQFDTRTMYSKDNGEALFVGDYT